jgi:hypothetical protein
LGTLFVRTTLSENHDEQVLLGPLLHGDGIEVYRLSSVPAPSDTRAGKWALPMKPGTQSP